MIEDEETVVPPLELLRRLRRIRLTPGLGMCELLVEIDRILELAGPIPEDGSEGDAGMTRSFTVDGLGGAFATLEAATGAARGRLVSSSRPVSGSIGIHVLIQSSRRVRVLRVRETIEVDDV